MFKINDKFTSSNHYASALFRLAERKGLDATHLLTRAGIDPKFIDSPDYRIKTEHLAIAVQLLWVSLQDENMGLTSAPCRYGTFYMMGKLTIHQLTLGKALELGFRYYGFITDGFKVTLTIKNDIAKISILLKQPELDNEHLFSEMTLLAWHRYSSWLIDEDLPLTNVYFDYPAPEHAHEYVYLYPGKHCFNHSQLGFSFHKKYLSKKIMQTETSLKNFMNNCPAMLFLRTHRNGSQSNASFTHHLQKRLAKQVEVGLPDLLTTANLMHMSQRTVIRKLKQEGTSYQQIKNLVRRDTAIFFLTQQQTPIAEIAEKVGYSDSAVFARAFKSWTDLSPLEYRIKVLND